MPHRNIQLQVMSYRLSRLPAIVGEGPNRNPGPQTRPWLEPAPPTLLQNTPWTVLMWSREICGGGTDSPIRSLMMSAKSTNNPLLIHFKGNAVYSDGCASVAGSAVPERATEVTNASLGACCTCSESSFRRCHHCMKCRLYTDTVI